MQIIWHGQSCFQIITSQGKNNQVSIVIDPFFDEIGLKLPKIEADILLVTHHHQDHDNTKAVQSPKGGGNFFLIDGPGEYDVKNVFIGGIRAFHDNSQGKTTPTPRPPWFPPGLLGENTIYTIEAEDLKLCHLGDLGQKELTDEQLEAIGEVDILFIPVGGVYTVAAKEALNIMSQIEPHITIPMHYQIPKLKVKLDGLDKFLKSLGIKSIVPENKLSIKKKDILLEEAKIIVLKP